MHKNLSFCSIVTNIAFDVLGRLLLLDLRFGRFLKLFLLLFLSSLLFFGSFYSLVPLGFSGIRLHIFLLQYSFKRSTLNCPLVFDVSPSSFLCNFLLSSLFVLLSIQNRPRNLLGFLFIKNDR